jgi:hypothetical protein
MSSRKLPHPGLVADIGTLNTSRLEYIMDIIAASIDLGTISLEKLDLIIQNCNEVGNRFIRFLRTIGSLIIHVVSRSRVISINRTETLDPIQFMLQKGLEIEEQDERSIILEEIDPSNITLESMLQGETIIRGEEHLKRLKQMGHVRLDAKIFQTLWENQHLIPKSWKGTSHGPKYIFFDGTVLKNHDGRYVISIYWDRKKKWRWAYYRLDVGYWKTEDLSAVLKVC